MQRFKVGDIVYAYVSGKGYVGIGEIKKLALPFQDATLEDGKTKLVDSQQAGKLQGVYIGGAEADQVDWIALVDWIKAVDREKAVSGMVHRPVKKAEIFAKCSLPAQSSAQEFTKLK